MSKLLLQPALIYRSQQGIALILLVLALLMTGTIFFVASIVVDKGRIEADKESTDALAKAKDALISYAVSYYERNNPGIYGMLPCVEDTNPPATTDREGIESFNCETVSRYENSIGRLPWKTLGIGPVKDSSGECLWYAVSGDYLNAGTALSNMHNEDSPGMFVLQDQNGNTIKGNLAEDRIVAVVIAPGFPIGNQNRPDVDPNITPPLPCKIHRITARQNISAYLDNLAGINNSDVSNIINSVDQFVTSLTSTNPNLNDRFVTISAAEIFNAIKRNNNFTTRMNRMTEALAVCISTYANNNPGNSGTPAPPCPELCSDICYPACDAMYDCNSLPPGPGRGQCRQNLNQCRQTCRDNGCVNNVNQRPPNCGTGGGIVDKRMPWPALVDLYPNDYRQNNLYDDNNTNGHLGRYPFVVDTSNNDIPRATPANNLFQQCTSLNLPVSGINVNLNDTNNEYRRLWEHWKDHVFYAISQDFRPTAPTPTPEDDATCNNCISVTCTTCAPPINGNKYAGIVIYSGSVANGLTRRSVPPEIDNPLINNTKGVITNYLESHPNFPDNNGNGTYIFNDTILTGDIAYCINNDPSLTVSRCSP